MMKLYLGVFVLLASTFALADPTTQPTGPVPPSKPTLPNPSPTPPLPTPDHKPIPLPSPSPTPVPDQKPDADDQKPLPAPGDLIRQMKDAQAKKDKATKVAFFDLSTPIAEKPADFSLLGGADAALTLRSLVDRIHQARDDKDIKAVLLTVGDHSLSLSQAVEVRDALLQLKQKGKRTFVYADSYDTTGYTLATGATDICLLEGGEMMIPGIGLEATFYKGLFDKLGVKADYVQIGEYKGADEEYTREGASDELKGEFNKLTNSLYDQIVDGIATRRNLPRNVVSEMVDNSMISAKAAKAQGFVDHLLDEDSLRPMLTEALGNEINLLHDYGAAPRQTVDFSSPLAFFQLLNRPQPTSEKPAVALIYADGVITDGQGEGGMFSEAGVASAPMREALRAAARDDNVKAVVIRINSPGGSALASEVMWQAAKHVADRKPLIISVGGMAASGGYYLASAGDRIFADPTSIVGSIGVVGGKFVLRDLYDKLGLKTESFQRGANAGLFSSNTPFTDAQRKMVTAQMRETYVQFTERVMTTRTGKIKDIDQVARGRIFTAKQALDLGMVDSIGGITDAIADAAHRAELDPNQYDVRILPAPKTFADMLGLGAGPQAMTPFKPLSTVAPDSLLSNLPDSVRASITQQLTTLKLLQSHPVVLVAPFTVTIH